jgi:hypothetical protein
MSGRFLTSEDCHECFGFLFLPDSGDTILSMAFVRNRNKGILDRANMQEQHNQVMEKESIQSTIYKKIIVSGTM